MKKPLALGVMLACLALPAHSDPVHGSWQTQVDEGAYGVIEFATCGAKLCGTLVRAFDDGKEVKSKSSLIVWDMEPKGDGTYRNGRIFQPKSGKEYRSKMDLVDPNTLSVSGCIGPFCKKQTWKRLN